MSRTMIGRPACLVTLLALSAGCATDEFTSAQLGERLFNDPKSFSSSKENAFSCSTCHDAELLSSGIRKPGASLRGVLERPSYWGGAENDVLTSINHCVRYFMLSSKAIEASSTEAEALYAYLESLTPLTAEDALPVPFTIPRVVEDVPRGDPAVGGPLYAQACGSCHGVIETGAARLTKEAPILPKDTIAEHPGYTPGLLRLVFIEKTRHGVFIGYGGSMPPISQERLSDAELGAVLEYMGITGR